MDVEVGPIWNHAHAEEIAHQYEQDNPGTKWNGQWRTTVPGRKSVIGVEHGHPYNVEVGPIWNNDHAREVAQQYEREHPDLRWTGHWNTTIPCRMSVIKVQRRG